MDALAIARAVIVGHSMGSLVARRVAVDHAERVAALMLIGGFATVKGNAAAEALWHDAIASMRDPVDPAFVRDFQQSTLARPVPAAFFEEVVAQSLKMPARVWQSTFRALLDEDRSDDLARVAVPTAIVWGDQDAFQRQNRAGADGARDSAGAAERLCRHRPLAAVGRARAGRGRLCWRCCWQAAHAARRERVSGRVPRAVCSLPRIARRQTGVNALSLGEGWGGG